MDNAMDIEEESNVKMDIEEHGIETRPLGLYSKDVMLPLFKTDINADIADKFARVNLTHIYYNPYDEYLSTCFKFPKGLYEVFDGIEAEIDGKKIKGLVGLRKEVKIKYVSELNKGSTVVGSEELGPSSRVKSEILIINIGNIPPKKEIKITFSFLQSLDITLNKKYRFILPLVLTPRYIPDKEKLVLLKDFVYNGQKEENNKKLNDLLKAGKIKYIKFGNNLQYFYNLKVIVHSEPIIEKIETKVLNQSFIIQKYSPNDYVIFLDPNGFHIPNQDFVLEYEIAENDLKMPTLLLEKHPKYQNDYCLYYSFNPFEELKTSFKEIVNPINEDMKGNFIFLVDRSGAMYGNKLNMVKQSLIYFLKSLPVNGSKFNIISYGSNIHTLFKSNQLVNKENVNKALKSAKGFEANMGKISLNHALELIMSLIEKDLSNRIFVITAGDVLYIEECLKIVDEIYKDSEFEARFYSLGIGNGCSESLVRGIAQKGGGESEFVKNEEDINEKIIYLLKCSMNYCLSNLIFKLKINDDKILIKNSISTLINSNIEIYALLDNPSLLNNNSVIFTFSFKEKTFYFEKEIKLDKAFMADTLHKIFLGSIIEKPIDPNLAVKYQILTPDTAFYCLVQENNLSDEELLNKKYEEIKNTPPIELEQPFGVKRLTGEFIELKFCASDTVEMLKAQIFEKENIPIEQQRLIYARHQLEDDYTLEYYKINKNSVINLVLRCRGGGYTNINLTVYFNDEEKDRMIIGLSEAFKQTLEDFVKNEFKKLEIKGNLGDFDFLFDGELINDKMNKKLNEICRGNSDLKIFSKFDYNLSEEDKIILNQEENGLWKMDILKLGLVNFTKNNWDEFLDKNKVKIKTIFKNDISEDAIFNLFIISYLIKIAPDKIRHIFIIKKAIKGLNKEWPEINEEQVNLFKENIEV